MIITSQLLDLLNTINITCLRLALVEDKLFSTIQINQSINNHVVFMAHLLDVYAATKHADH